jgi:hypothetical protein
MDRESFACGSSHAKIQQSTIVLASTINRVFNVVRPASRVAPSVSVHASPHRVCARSLSSTKDGSVLLSQLCFTHAVPVVDRYRTSRLESLKQPRPSHLTRQFRRQDAKAACLQRLNASGRPGTTTAGRPSGKTKKKGRGIRLCDRSIGRPEPSSVERGG